MSIRKTRTWLCALLALLFVTTTLAGSPTPQQALEYATSVILVKRVLKDNKVHAYVKEVWRIDPKAAAPALGSEYGDPIPYNPKFKNPERDGICFTFGDNRPKELPTGWRIPVTEDGTVPPFNMDVDAVRKAVKDTKPKE